MCRPNAYVLTRPEAIKIRDELRLYGVRLSLEEVQAFMPPQIRATGMWINLVESEGATTNYREFMAERAGLQSCRECGCTKDDACADGCYWVAADLCSACAK